MVTTVFCYYDTVEARLVICAEYSSEEQIRLKNCSLGAREVAHLLKCLLGRHGDLSSGPQHPWGLAIATRNALVGEVGLPRQFARIREFQALSPKKIRR